MKVTAETFLESKEDMELTFIYDLDPFLFSPPLVFSPSTSYTSFFRHLPSFFLSSSSPLVFLASIYSVFHRLTSPFLRFLPPSLSPFFPLPFSFLPPFLTFLGFPPSSLGSALFQVLATIMNACVVAVAQYQSIHFGRAKVCKALISRAFPRLLAGPWRQQNADKDPENSQPFVAASGQPPGTARDERTELR